MANFRHVMVEGLLIFSFWLFVYLVEDCVFLELGLRR
jgi:hypothetical protein